MSVSQQTTDLATKLIKQAEGYQSKIYKDNAKQQNPTIHWGHKVLPGQVFDGTKQQGQRIFQQDLKIAIERAQKSYGDGFDKLSPQRQAVIIDMAFNMGSVASFPSMIKSLKNGQFDQAALHLLDSKYRVQVKARAYRNSYILKQDKVINRDQALQKSIQDNLLSQNKKNKITYSNEIKDPRINNILNKTKTDADIAKQMDTIKKANVGGVSFDFDPLTTRLNGMIIDEKNVKVIAGDVFDKSNFSFMDLVVPLKIMYDPEIKSKNISVSLDPYVLTEPDGPWYRKVFYPKQLSNTGYGEDMISADFLMKQLSLGVDEENNPFPYNQRLLKMGIDIQSIFKYIEQKSYVKSRTRLWIVIKDYEVAINENFFEIKSLKMGVELKALETTENGSLKDCNDEPSAISKRFAELFTKHYDELAEIYPILDKMKRLAKASIMAKLMFFKRVPVDMDLINRIFKKQMMETEQKLPRLQNKLKKQHDNIQVQLQILGGCTFDISNMQQKISTLQKQIKQIRQFYKAKDLNSNTVPLKSIDSQIGQFLFVNNQKDQIKNNKIYPFLFQNLLKCKHCDKLCNLDYYSVTNKQCFDHSSMKCKICNQLILPGEDYKMNNDKSMAFHAKCFKCSGCNKKIDGPFAKIDGGQYHPECVPKKLIGMCDQCKKQIYQGDSCAQNSQTLVYYHAECAKILNQRIMDSIPNCKYCDVKLQGPYVKYKNEPYHEQCAKKMLNSNSK